MATLVVGWQCELADSFISSVVVYKATSSRLCDSRAAGCEGAQAPDGGRIVMSQKGWQHSAWRQRSGNAETHEQVTLKWQMGSLNETAGTEHEERGLIARKMSAQSLSIAAYWASYRGLTLWGVMES